MYSFIKPKPKTIIKKLTKIWIFYILLSISIILIFSCILENQTQNLKNDHTNLINQIHQQKLKTIAMYEYINRLEYESKISTHIVEENQKNIEAIEKLFYAVPSQISLEKIIIKEDGLIISGVAMSKQSYKFLLEVPLRMIFKDINVEFSPLSSGKVYFTAISKSGISGNPINQTKSLR